MRFCVVPYFRVELLICVLTLLSDPMMFVVETLLAKSCYCLVVTSFGDVLLLLVVTSFAVVGGKCSWIEYNFISSVIQNLVENLHVINSTDIKKYYAITDTALCCWQRRIIAKVQTLNVRGTKSQREVEARTVRIV